MIRQITYPGAAHGSLASGIKIGSFQKSVKLSKMCSQNLAGQSWMKQVSLQTIYQGSVRQVALYKHEGRTVIRSMKTNSLGKKRNQLGLNCWKAVFIKRRKLSNIKMGINRMLSAYFNKIHVGFHQTEIQYYTSYHHTSL